MCRWRFRLPTFDGRRGGRRHAEANRAGRDGRPYPPLQSQPSGFTRILAGEFKVQQMDVQTYFFRRTNMNALGKPRSWTDHLLWHHAAHTVDLFAYQTGSPIVKANALQGPIHPTLGIAMDMSIQLKAANGAICTLSLRSTTKDRSALSSAISATTATYIARYDDLFNGKDEKIDVCQSRCLDERHRVAGSRILCRHPRRPRAERQRRPGAALLPRARRPRARDGVDQQGAATTPDSKGVEQWRTSPIRT